MIKLIFALAVSLSAQTTTSIAYNGNVGADLADYYAASSDAANRGIIVAGHYTSFNSSDRTCNGFGECGIYTHWTQDLNYNIFSVTTRTGTFPQAIQEFKCALSFLVAHPGTYGNVNNLILYGESGGSLLVLLSAVAGNGAWLNDGNANCSTSNIGFTITMAIGNSAIPNVTNTSPGLYSQCCAQSPVQTLLGGAPTGCPNATCTLALAASADQYVSTWAATVPIAILTGGTQDTSVPRATQAMMQTAAAANGYNTYQFLADGETHGGDSQATFCTTWKCSGYNVLANFTGSSNCPHSDMPQYSPCGPFGLFSGRIDNLIGPNSATSHKRR